MTHGMGSGRDDFEALREAVDKAVDPPGPLEYGCCEARGSASTTIPTLRHLKTSLSGQLRDDPTTLIQGRSRRGAVRAPTSEVGGARSAAASAMSTRPKRRNEGVSRLAPRHGGGPIAVLEAGAH
jgi:hypothetical protein